VWKLAGGPAAVERRGFPWELKAVIGLLVLALGLNLRQLWDMGWVAAVPVTITALCILGVGRRSDWGWWLTVVLVGLGVLQGAVFVFRVAARAGWGPEYLLFLVPLGMGAGVIWLLVRCRRRGAYPPDPPAKA
jgi:hypothetical protein